MFILFCRTRWPRGLWRDFAGIAGSIPAGVSVVCCQVEAYEGVAQIFRTDAVKIINLATKRLWKLPTSTQLRATWHTDSLDMVVLPSDGASRYHNCCIGSGTSPEYFGYTLVCDGPIIRLLESHRVCLRVMQCDRVQQ
jgi:hypothetical protein